MACALIDRISEPIVLDGAAMEITASVGGAIFPEDGDTADTLMKNADIAMYSAKASGGATINFFKPECAVTVKARLDVLRKLKRAAANREFVLHYQPIVEMDSKIVKHYEALVRWRCDGVLIYPGDFITLAEETGHISAIGRFVIDESFRQIRSWMDAGQTAQLSINISRVQFQEENFVEEVVACAATHGIETAMVVLEITESSIITNPGEAKTVIERLIAAGFKIAIDDFGAGYSSLGFLVD